MQFHIPMSLCSHLFTASKKSYLRTYTSYTQKLRRAAKKSQGRDRVLQQACTLGYESRLRLKRVAID